MRNEQCGECGTTVMNGKQNEELWWRTTERKKQNALEGEMEKWEIVELCCALQKCLEKCRNSGCPVVPACFLALLSICFIGVKFRIFVEIRKLCVHEKF